MNIGISDLPSLPPIALAAIGLLVLVQLILQIYSLIDLARRPASGLTWDKKWGWVLIIVLGEIVGSVVYLIAGRKTPAAKDPLKNAGREDASDRAERAADVLYGKKE